MRRIIRFLFSRYLFSGLIILFEITLILLLVIFASSYSVGAFVFMVSINILALISLINREANPEYKVSWLAVMTLLPFFGVVLYLVFYSRRLSGQEARLLSSLGKELRSLSASPEEDAFLELCEVDHEASGRALAILNDDPMANIYRSTEMEYFSSGEVMFNSLISDIRAARRFVFLEYFIVEEGVMWGKIRALLEEKAREGVDVRLIYDDFGCIRTLSHNYDMKLRERGIDARRFSKITPRLSTAHNNRDHRKIAVIDGVIGYTGGINLADEYINEKCRFGHWKDGGIRLFGDGARGLLSLFLASWDLSSGAASDKSELFFDSKDSDGDGGFYIPFGSGPSPIYTRPVGKGAYLTLINQAKEYVYITTPYLIIDYDLTEAMKNAARRGVDVRIITPAIADKRTVKIMTKNSYSPLIRAGVRIYEYTPGFIHEKTVISDGLFGIVGTINFDYRSLAHHFEDAVWIYNSPCLREICEDFQKTLSVSKKIDEREARLTLGERIVRWGVRIIAPLL